MVRDVYLPAIERHFDESWPWRGWGWEREHQGKKDELDWKRGKEKSIAFQSRRESEE